MAMASEIMSWLELEKGVHVCGEWLQACVEWILNEVSSLDISKPVSPLGCMPWVLAPNFAFDVYLLDFPFWVGLRRVRDSLVTVARIQLTRQNQNGSSRTRTNHIICT